MKRRKKMAGTLKCVYIMILIVSLCFLVAGGIKFNGYILIPIFFVLFIYNHLSPFCNIYFFLFYIIGECRNINDCYRKYSLVPYGYMRCIRGHCKLQRDVKVKIFLLYIHIFL